MPGGATNGCFHSIPASKPKTIKNNSGDSMITISPAMIKAKIESYDGQITIIEGRKSKLQGLLDDPELVEELAGILGELGSSNPTSGPEDAVAAKDKPDQEEANEESEEEKAEENKDAELNNGIYRNMRPSDATYALLSVQSNPGPFGISRIYDCLIKNGLLISGDARDTFKTFTIGIGQDERLVCDLKAESIAIRK
jgi:hypothetical protein